MSSSPTSLHICRKDSSDSLTPAFTKHHSDNPSDDEDEATTKCCGALGTRNCKANKDLSNCFSSFPRKHYRDFRKGHLKANLVQSFEKYVDGAQSTISKVGEGEEEDNRIIETFDDIHKQATDQCNYRYDTWIV